MTDLDIAVIWQEMAEKLTKYYSKEGFTYTNIIEVLPFVEDLFEKLLYETDLKETEELK